MRPQKVYWSCLTNGIDIQIRDDVDPSYVKVIATGSNHFEERIPRAHFEEMDVFGLFCRQLILKWNRNWIFLDIAANEVRAEPIGSIMEVVEGNNELRMQWYTTGVELNLRRGGGQVKSFVEGDIKGIQISSDKAQIRLSSFGSHDRMVSIGAEEVNGGDISNDIAFSLETINEHPVVHIRNIASKKSSSAILFLHGGPYQRFSREQNTLLEALVSQGYEIYVPVYPGDPCREANYLSQDPWDQKWIEKLRSLVMQISEKHASVVVLGHSFGCYLGYWMLNRGECGDIPFVSLNGIFELYTARETSPQTFAKAKADRVTDRKPRLRNWIHFHSVHDKVVRWSALMASLERLGTSPTRLIPLDSQEHEITDPKVVATIVATMQAV